MTLLLFRFSWMNRPPADQTVHQTRLHQTLVNKWKTLFNASWGGGCTLTWFLPFWNEMDFSLENRRATSSRLFESECGAAFTASHWRTDRRTRWSNQKARGRGWELGSLMERCKTELCGNRRLNVDWITEQQDRPLCVCSLCCMIVF